jgi:hypothetical protein
MAALKSNQSYVCLTYAPAMTLENYSYLNNQCTHGCVCHNLSSGDQCCLIQAFLGGVNKWKKDIVGHAGWAQTV